MCNIEGKFNPDLSFETQKKLLYRTHTVVVLSKSNYLKKNNYVSKRNWEDLEPGRGGENHQNQPTNKTSLPCYKK